jgi:cyclic pyranopterin phosphate synthase
MQNITDIYNRSFKSLRVSLLSACNFGCLYCVDEEQVGKRNSCGSDRMADEELIALILKLHRLLGLETIRLTGGEPLLFKGVADLVKKLKAAGVPRVTLTTNGVLLGRLATALAGAGLDALNVSLDALDPEVFSKITGRKHLHKVLEGIEAAKAAGIPVKLNTVIMRGFNEQEIPALLQFAQEKGIVIRFLELMKMGHLHTSGDQYFFSAFEMLAMIAENGTLNAMPRKAGATARYWQTGSGQVFGIIANESIPFCSDCNRLRLDSTGKIYGCLSNPLGFSVRDADELGLQEILLQALYQKQPLRFTGSSMSMLAIGG